jgi:hypothetical protein
MSFRSFINSTRFNLAKNKNESSKTKLVSSREVLLDEQSHIKKSQYIKLFKSSALVLTVSIIVVLGVSIGFRLLANASSTTVSLQPSGDTQDTNVVGVGKSTTALYEDVADGTSFSNGYNNSSYVSLKNGVASGSHTVSYPTLPSNSYMSQATVNYRAYKGTATGNSTIQVQLYNGAKLIATGPVHTLGSAYVNYSDVLSGLSVSQLYLSTKVTLTNSGSVGAPRYTLIWINAVITVIPPPTVTITATPSSIASGATSTLNWSTTNASSCTASGGWTGTEATSGSLTTAALSANTQYNLSCTGVGGTTTANTTVTVETPAQAGFVTTSGTSLILNGQSTQFIGFDAPGMEGCWNGVNSNAWTNAELDTYFAALPPNGLTRVWAMQYFGTAVITNIIAQATKYNQHLVISLGNDEGQCNPTSDDPSQTGEPLSFYQSGWQTIYVPWVNTIVPMFATNPTVAMWEIADEPGQNATVPEATMQSYMNGTSAAIKAVAPNQLVESGFNWAGNANNSSQGTVSDYEAVQSSPNINVISYHDFSYDYEGGDQLSWNFENAQQAAIDLNKPFVIGETGIEAGPNSSCTTYLTESQRASWFETKANDYFEGIGPGGGGSPGAAGIMLQAYVPEGPGADCTQYDYDIGPSDPTVTMVQNYVVPPPTISISATPSAIPSGATSTIAWSTTAALSCTASGGWSGPEATSGSFTTAALSANTQYNLSCTGNSGTSAANTTVTIETPAQAGFVTASGTNLMLNGQVTQFIGFDAYGMEGCDQGYVWTTADLDTYFASLPANGLTRIWADQYFGTAVLSNIIAQAAKYHQHLILSLGDDDGNCDPTADDPNQTGEPLSFYQGGWEGQYVSWVNTVVPMFATNPTVAMWEIANEPGQVTSVPEATLQSYMNGTSAAIKAVDPNQLIESGFNYDGNANNNTQGTEADYTAVQSSPNINVISYHDYSYDYEGGANLSYSFTLAQEASTSLNKPFITGEAGVEGGTGCTMTLTQRAAWFETKANDYFQGIGDGGASTPNDSAVLFWDYQPGTAPTCSTNDYTIYPGDPTITMVQNYVIPN